MNFDLFTYLSSLAYIFVYGRLIIHFAPGVIRFLLNEPFKWEKNLEKPRILFHLIGLGFMHLMTLSSVRKVGLEFELITIVILFLGFLLCLLSWTDKFKISFQQTKNQRSKKTSKNFDLSISNDHIVQLYNDLVRYELIDYGKTTLDDFRNVLLKDWNSHNSRIFFNLDGPSCREFYEYFVRAFPKNSMSLKKLFVTSGLILRPDGKKYNYNTLKNAPTRTPVSKDHSKLSAIFNRLT